MYGFLRNAVIAVLLGSIAAPALAADAWYATRTLMPGDIIRDTDVTAQTPVRPVPDLLPSDRSVVGLEIKRRIAPNRPLTERDVGPRTVIKVNASVDVLWRAGALTLEMQGKALESGAMGDEIRVLNTASNRTIRGTVTGEGTVEMRAVP